MSTIVAVPTEQTAVFQSKDGSVLVNCPKKLYIQLMVVGSISTVTTSLIFIFYFLLKLQLICVEHVYPPKVINLK